MYFHDKYNKTIYIKLVMNSDSSRAILAQYKTKQKQNNNIHFSSLAVDAQ